MGGGGQDCFALLACNQAFTGQRHRFSQRCGKLPHDNGKVGRRLDDGGPLRRGAQLADKVVVQQILVRAPCVCVELARTPPRARHATRAFDPRPIRRSVAAALLRRRRGCSKRLQPSHPLLYHLAAPDQLLVLLRKQRRLAPRRLHLLLALAHHRQRTRPTLLRSRRLRLPPAAPRCGDLPPAAESRARKSVRPPAGRCLRGGGRVPCLAHPATPPPQNVRLPQPVRLRLARRARVLRRSSPPPPRREEAQRDAAPIEAHGVRKQPPPPHRPLHAARPERLHLVEHQPAREVSGQEGPLRLRRVEFPEYGGGLRLRAEHTRQRPVLATAAGTRGGRCLLGGRLGGAFRHVVREKPERARLPPRGHRREPEPEPGGQQRRLRERRCEVRSRRLDGAERRQRQRRRRSCHRRRALLPDACRRRRRLRRKVGEDRRGRRSRRELQRRHRRRCCRSRCRRLWLAPQARRHRRARRGAPARGGRAPRVSFNAHVGRRHRRRRALVAGRAGLCARGGGGRACRRRRGRVARRHGTSAARCGPRRLGARRGVTGVGSGRHRRRAPRLRRRAGRRGDILRLAAARRRQRRRRRVQGRHRVGACVYGHRRRGRRARLRGARGCGLRPRRGGWRRRRRRSTRHRRGAAVDDGRPRRRHKRNRRRGSRVKRDAGCVRSEAHRRRLPVVPERQRRRRRRRRR
eukprot:Rhum_TRINITY_DN14584_c8_g1::Rhum_TRINITY_DN14584_c8_g1_i1::g.99586::m.99586